MKKINATVQQNSENHYDYDTTVAFNRCYWIVDTGGC